MNTKKCYTCNDTGRLAGNPNYWYCEGYGRVVDRDSEEFDNVVDCQWCDPVPCPKCSEVSSDS